MAVAGSAAPVGPRIEPNKGRWVGTGRAASAAAELNRADDERRAEEYAAASLAASRYEAAAAGYGAILWLIPAGFSLLSLLLQALIPFRGLMQGTA